jgi:WD40 repeat protein
MSHEPSSQADRSQRLEQLLAEYLRALERGQPLDEECLVREHPDLEDELRSFFRNRAAVQKVADEVQAHEMPTGDFRAALHVPAPGDRIRYFGDYELLEEIARGGMGVVYKARQISLQRTVALKMVLAGQFASEPEVRRFRAEAEAAANLDHPNIVPIYEVGQHEGQHYFSMAYIEGGSLSTRMADYRDKPREAVALMIQLCRAVHFAHQRGILHRDLKPANILIDPAGQPHVSDFGLAKRVGSESSLTLPGAVVGTPCYMAPEQARGEKTVTTAVDVYGLGAVLYELLTGQPPFRAATPAETLRQVLEREPTPPRLHHRQVDRDLETIVLKCLEKEPARRYESAAALADDLVRRQRGEPIVARPIGLVERTWKWVKRHPTTAALWGMAAAVLLLVTVGGVLVRQREARLKELADIHQQQAELAKERATRAQRAAEAEQANRAKAESEQRAAQRERDIKQLETHKSTVKANLLRVKAMRTGDERRPATEALQLLAHSAALRRAMEDSAARLGDDAVQETHGFWSSIWPELNDEAIQWLTQSTFVLERSFTLPTGASDDAARDSIRSNTQNMGSHPYAVSPDGTWLVRPGKGNWESQALDLVDIKTGTIAGTVDVMPPGDRRTAITPAFTADGHLLIASLGDRYKLHVEKRAVPSGENVHSVTIDLLAIFPAPAEGRVFRQRPLAEALYQPAIFFSADHQRITIFQPGPEGWAAFRHGIRRFDFPGLPAAVFEVATGKLIAKAITDFGFEAVAATPSGDQLVGWRQKDETTVALELFDITTGQVVHRREVHRRERVQRVKPPSYLTENPYEGVIESTVSPDGRWLATDWGLHEITGSQSFLWILVDQFRRYGAGLGGVAVRPRVTFSPDSRFLLAVTGGELQVYSVPQVKLLGSKPHGLNAAKDDFFSEEVTEPVAVRFLPDGRVVAGFAPSRPGRGPWRRPTPGETWQVWHVLTPRVSMPAPYQRARSLTTARFLPDKPVAYLATDYPFKFKPVDFSREEVTSFLGPRGEERRVGPAELWRGPPDVSYGYEGSGALRFHWDDFDRSGRWFLFGHQVWDVKEGRLHRSLLEKGTLLARSADRRYVALRSGPPVDLADGRPAMNPLQGLLQAMGVLSRAASPVQVWDLEADREVCRFDSRDWSLCHRFLFSPDGKYLVGAYTNYRNPMDEEQVVIGSVADGKTIGTAKGSLAMHQGRSPFDPSATILVLTDRQGDPQQGAVNVLRLVALATGQTIEPIPYRESFYGSDELEWVISRGGESLALVCSSEQEREKSELVLWSAKEGKRPPAKLDLGRPGLATAINGDGTRVVVAGAASESRLTSDPDKLLQVWDVSKQELVATIGATKGKLSSWLLLPASNALAVSFEAKEERGSGPLTTEDIDKRRREAEQQRRCELWDLHSGTLRATFPGSYDQGQAADGKYLVLASSGKTKIIEAATGQIWFEVEGDFWVRTSGAHNHSDAELSPDGSILLLQSRAGLVLCRPEEKHLVTVPVRGTPVRQSKQYRPLERYGFRWWFTPDSALFITEDPQTGVLSFWDTRDGVLTRTLDPRGPHTLPGGQVGGHNDVTPSPDGKAVAVEVHGQIRLFDLSSGQRLCAFPRHGHQGTVRAVAVSPDGRWVATGGTDRTVGLWHAADGTFAAMLDGYAGPVGAVEFTPDGKQLLTRDTTGLLALWQIDAAAEASSTTPEVTFVWQRRAVPPPENRPALAISPDGRHFACGNADGTLWMALLSDGSEERTISVGTSAVLSVAYRHDGQVLATGRADGMVRLWDAHDGKPIVQWSAEQADIRALAFQPATGLLATAGHDVRLWQTAPPQLLLHVHQPEKPLCDLSFSRDGRYVLTCGDDQTVRCFDLEAQRQALREVGLGW